MEFYFSLLSLSYSVFPFRLLSFFVRFIDGLYGTSVFFLYFFPSCLLMVDGWMEGRKEGRKERIA